MTEWRSLKSFAFGDSPALGDELAALVLAGRKRATCWPVAEGAQTAVGNRMVMLDGLGRPRAVLETVELVQLRFGDVDAAFAFDEGEGDRTLAAWRAAHRRYFTRRGEFSEDLALWCERFRLVEVIESD
ncbi:ASCH domain-containing protein [Rubrimonas sp.]|uniref:ASCH domain-containing protein n=1 Tax=Rubrimonas sp. TaxID=2036015 RepID=UPI002FDD6528